MDTAVVPFGLSPDTVVTLRIVLRNLHFIGLGIGLGAASLLDLLILRFLHQRTVTRAHVRWISFGSHVITVGLVLLWLSGLGFITHYALFDPAKLMNQKIWAKMVIVAILTLNGVFIHYVVLPTVRRGVGQNLFVDISRPHRGILLASGVVSGLSWYVPLVLGATPQLNWLPMWLILGVYAVLVMSGIAVSQVLCRMYWPREIPVMTAEEQEAYNRTKLGRHSLLVAIRKERRHFKRFDVNLSCQIDLPGPVGGIARITSLSEGGARIVGGPRLANGGAGMVQIDGLSQRLRFIAGYSDGGGWRLIFAADKAGRAQVRSFLDRLTLARADALVGASEELQEPVWKVHS